MIFTLGVLRETCVINCYDVLQVMELSELHNPHCKLHASQSFEDHSPVRERRHSDVSDIFLSPEAYKATQAVEFIAEHLRNEDEYVQVRNNLKSKNK